MTSEPAESQQHQATDGMLGRATPILGWIIELPSNAWSYLSCRRSWFWIPVVVVAICSMTASSIIFISAFITERQEGPLEVTIFLYVAGLAVLAGPIVFMATALDSVRAWLDLHYNEPPPRE